MILFLRIKTTLRVRPIVAFFKPFKHNSFVINELIYNKSILTVYQSYHIHIVTITDFKLSFYDYEYMIEKQSIVLQDTNAIGMIKLHIFMHTFNKFFYFFKF